MEKQLIAHCAPTLAGIKPANLFRYIFSDEEALASAVSGANGHLNPKGIYVEILRADACGALLLVYRLSLLSTALARRGTRDFLAKYGYQMGSAAGCIDSLKSRFGSDCEFPHEIGIFLGYPLDDVIGFINNRGQNSKHTGCWKVYHNEKEAIERFGRYKRCTLTYARLFSQGRSIEWLTVAV